MSKVLFNPDGSSDQSTWSPWNQETSEDEASTEEFSDFRAIPRRHEDESSEDLQTFQQYVVTMSPLEGERGFDLSRSLWAKFSIPGAAPGKQSVIDPRLVVCEPHHEVRVYWKTSTVLEVVPVTKWKGSTSYTVRVSPSAINRLEEEAGVVFRFHTHPLRVQMYSRISRDDPLRPVFKLVPNQLVDVEKLLRGLVLTSRPKGVAGYLVSSVTGFQRSAHTFKLLSANSEVIEVIPNGPLPPNSVAELSLAAGSYSLDGSNPSEEAFSVEFNTYPPLTIVSRFPGYFSKIVPGEPWRINFSNDLQIPADRLQSMVEISPSVPFVVTTSFDSRMCITPETDAFSTYRLTLSASISDIYGQTLGQPDSFSFSTGPWPEFEGSLLGQHQQSGSTEGNYLISYFGGDRKFSYLQTNMFSLVESVYALRGDILPVDMSGDSTSKLSGPKEGVEEWIKAHGKLLWKEEKSLARHSKDWQTINWGDHLPSFGRIGIIVEPGDALRARLQGTKLHGSSLTLACIIQCSSMAMSSVSLGSSTVISVSRLSDGAPVVGALVREADGGSKLGFTNEEGCIVVSRLPELRLLGVAPENPSDVCFFIASNSPPVTHEHAFCYAISDAFSYCRKDVVRIKTWARGVPRPQKNATLEKFRPGELLSWKCIKAGGTDLTSGATVYNTHSSGTIMFEIPAEAELGQYRVEFFSDLENWNERDALIGVHTFDVVEKGTGASYCELDVRTMTNCSVGAATEDCLAIASVQADRSQGIPLVGAHVRWSVRAVDAPLDVPLDTWQSFVFGEHALEREPSPLAFSMGPLASELNSQGCDRICIFWSGQDVVNRPVQVQVSAIVQEFDAPIAFLEKSFIIAPSPDPLVGLSLVRSWSRFGEVVEISAVVLSRTSFEPVTKCHLSVSLVLLGSLDENVMDVEFTGTPAVIKFTPKGVGQYVIQGRVGTSKTSIPLVVIPSDDFKPSTLIGTSNRKALSLVRSRPDDMVSVGGSFELMVISLELPNASGLLTVHSSSGLLCKKAFRVQSNGTSVVSVTCGIEWFPSCCVRVFLWGSSAGVPSWAEGELFVDITKDTRRLQVAVQGIESPWDPSSTPELTLQVKVSDMLSGVNVEGVELFLIGSMEDIPNVLPTFYPVVHASACSSNQRAHLLFPRSIRTLELEQPQQSTSSEEGGANTTRSFVDLNPEEDTRDKLSVVMEDSSSVFETTADETSSNELDELLRGGGQGIVCVGLEWAGQQWIFAGEAKLESLCAKIVKSVPEVGKKSIPDGDLVVLVHRSASNCVAFCVLTKSFPLGNGYSLLDEVLTRTLASSPIGKSDLKSSLVKWNQVTALDTSNKSLGVSPLKQRVVHALHCKELMSVTTRLVPKKFQKWEGALTNLFLSCPVASNKDGVLNVNLNAAAFGPNLPSDGKVTCSIMAAASSSFGVEKAVITVAKDVKVELSCPEILRPGDVVAVRVLLTRRSQNCNKVTVRMEGPDLPLVALDGTSFEATFSSSSDVAVIVAGFRAESPGLANVDVVGKLRVIVNSGLRSQEFTRLLRVLLPSGNDCNMCNVGVVSGQLGEGSSGSSESVCVKLPPNASAVSMVWSPSQMVFLSCSLRKLLNDASDYAELLSSRALALCAVLSSYPNVGLHMSLAEVKGRLAMDAEKLLEMQGALGGFGMWSRFSVSSSFLSTHAAHALWEIHKAGIEVPLVALERCRAFVDSASRAPITSRKDIRARAYATFVGVKMGACIVSASQARRVAMEDDHSDLDTLGWLLGSVCVNNSQSTDGKKKPAPGRLASFWGLFGVDAAAKERGEALDALVTRLLDVFANRKVTLPRESGVAAPQFDYLYSSCRGLGVALDCLLLALDEMTQNKSPKLASVQRDMDAMSKELLSSRATDGCWETSQETCFCTMALARFFNTYEERPNDNLSQMTVTTSSGEVIELEALSADVRSCSFEAKELPKPELRLSGIGYFCVNASLLRNNAASVHAVANGFSVSRSFEGLDKSQDVVVLDGSNVRVKLGTRVRVTVRFSSDSDSNFQVVLVDQLCAGFDVIAPRMLGSEKCGQSTLSRAQWEDRVVRRTEALEVFADRLIGGGERTFSYVVRASNGGRFMVPPAFILERYRPKRFGRSLGVCITIE